MTGIYTDEGHQQASRSVSEDFLHWSDAEVIFEGRDLMKQIHDMIVVRHAGLYLGMVGLFDIRENRQWCELAWSPNSIDWHWIDPDTPLIPNSKRMGDYDWGCIFASVPMIGKDSIRMYYGSNDGRFMGWRNGFLCQAWLRADGFAGYEQIAGGFNQSGSLKTILLTVVDASLAISADVIPYSGSVRVTLLNEDDKVLTEGKLVTNTVTDAEVEWKDGFSLKKLKGEKVKLGFELKDAKLYSFSFHK